MRGEYMDTNEAAFILGFKRRKIQKMCRDGELPAIRIGDDYRINRVEFEAALLRMRVVPSTAA